MGSWNGTCGITQMPIKSGEKIILFPIMKNKHANNGGSGFCYSHNQYSPISIPLVGTYDDYGGIEGITNNKEFVFRHFQGLIQMKEFEIDNYEHERQLSINSDYTGIPRTIEELIEVYMHEPIYKGLGFMMVHESVYKKIIEEMSQRKEYRKTKTLKETYLEDGKAFLGEYNEIKKNEAEIENQLDELRTKRQEDPENQKLIEEFFTLFRKRDVLYGDFQKHFKKNRFIDYFEYTKPNGYLLKEILIRLAEESEENQETILHEIVDLILFEHGFDLLRKTWSPQSGAGSQSAEYYLHKLVAEAIIQKEKSVIEEWFEENEAEDEEDIKFGKNITRETY